MISTVTTSTVTILTTSAIAGSLALVGVLVLITLLVQKELTTSSGNSRWLQLGKILNIGILPFMIAFVLIVVFKVIEALN
ncbi:MAG: hypothetical protein ACK2U1_24430 [Anaerolineales bacterium]|jgi:hypothetical protein